MHKFFLTHGNEATFHILDYSVSKNIKVNRCRFIRNNNKELLSYGRMANSEGQNMCNVRQPC